MPQAIQVIPPPPPPPATVANPTVIVNGQPQAVLGARDVQALRARRTALSDQLSSADGRRQKLREQLKDATGADKAGLEQRLKVLDDRIARLESDIDQNSQALASLPAQLSTLRDRGSPTFNNSSRIDMGDALPVLIVFTIFVLCPIAVAVARSIWKRGTPAKTTALPADTTQRLERMEQAMDSIAIEIERVSEGQRFVTKLMAERGTALGAGPAEPVAVPVGKRVSVSG